MKLPIPKLQTSNFLYEVSIVGGSVRKPTECKVPFIYQEKEKTVVKRRVGRSGLRMFEKTHGL